MRFTLAQVRHAVLVVALVAPAGVGAQARCRPLCAPVLLLQPGFVSTDVSGDASPETDLHVRIVTAIPTAITRTRLVAGVQWAPLRELAGRTMNEPSFVYGPAITALNERWLALELELLGLYSPAATVDDASDRSYTHKLLAQTDVLLKAGWLWADVESRWRDLGIYAMLGYVATGIEDDASPWILLTGVSVPVTP